MKNLNRILYLLAGVALIVLAIVNQSLGLGFMGVCIGALGLLGGNGFTNKFENGLFKEGLFKKNKQDK